MALKNIIFDLGDVLIPLRREEARKSFEALLPAGNPQTDIFSFKTLDAFMDYETGQISTEAFLERIRTYFRRDVSGEQIVDAWNRIIGDFPEVHVEMLRKLGREYRLFVLSNTNEIHVRKFEKEVPGVDHLGDLFEKLYYSHELGLRKPQEEIYQRVLSESSLNPAETLFADDLPENIESAGKLGLQTLHVTPGMDLPGWFNRL